MYPIPDPGSGRVPVVEVVSGDIKTLTFEAYNVVAGAVLNLTGFTEIAAEIFAMSGGLPTGASILSGVMAGDDFDVDVVSAAAGTFAIDLVAANTAALAGDYWLEFKLTDGSGNLIQTSPAILRITADAITS